MLKAKPIKPMNIITKPIDLPSAIRSNQLALSKYQDSRNPLVGSIDTLVYSSALLCFDNVFVKVPSGCFARS